MTEFFSKLSQKEKIGLSLAVVFVLIAFLDRLVVKPIKDRVEEVSRRIHATEEELKMDLRNLKEKKAISEEYEKYTQYVTKAGSDEEEVAKILAEIEEHARKSRIDLVDITPQAPKEADFYREYVAEIEVEGDMKSIVKFLYQLNNSALLLRTQKLRISPKEKDSSVVIAVILVTKILII
jgi:Tfp pilus assembly protein PilO